MRTALRSHTADEPYAIPPAATCAATRGAYGAARATAGAAAEVPATRHGQPRVSLLAQLGRLHSCPRSWRTGDRVGDLCCAKNYVAYRGGREGASGCLRADRGLWGRRRFRSLSRQRNIISAGLTSRPSRCGPTMSRSTRLTCMSRPARNSSDTCAIALGPRIAKPGRCRTSHAARVARERSTGPKICCAGKPRSHCNGATFARGQHSSARNIGRQLDRAVRDMASGKAVVGGEAYSIPGRVPCSAFRRRPRSSSISKLSASGWRHRVVG